MVTYLTYGGDGGELPALVSPAVRYFYPAQNFVAIPFFDASLTRNRKEKISAAARFLTP
ncbi:hypothetical protein [Citrobacter braakii]|uniref:hypothetical protein n=1 Tax=Citrobacter braakii TaxID=57706 RepID=UPI001CC5C6C8|nr:hypothetical protein [Citrobacter braakii]